MFFVVEYGSVRYVCCCGCGKVEFRFWGEVMSCKVEVDKVVVDVDFGVNLY